MTCRLLGLLIALVVLPLMATAPVHAQAAGAPRSYPAGWNLVALPPGTVLPPATPLYTLQPGDTTYEQGGTGQSTISGFGYWANLPAAGSGGYSRAITLAAGSSTPYSIPVPGGQWVLVGDPSGILAASVQGSDATYTFDPVHGYQLATTLQPGQGAWVMSAAGGVVTIAPRQAAAAVQPTTPATAAYPVVPSTTGAALPVTPLLPTPLQTNPQTAIWPAPWWTWWPAPSVVVLPWTVSAPYAGPFLCPSNVITAFALIFCGALSSGPP
jgi:hypothetical protein